jgi:hypothetical protein
MAVYEEGEKEDIEKEPMKLEHIGLVTLEINTDGIKRRGEMWLLYNFDVNGTGYILSGDVKLPEDLFFEMQETAKKAFSKVAPMASWTKQWSTVNGISGASESECDGNLLKLYASNDGDFNPTPTNVYLYGMTDQASGISPLNASLRKQRIKWVEETWFTEGKPEGVWTIPLLHKATNRASRSYFERRHYRGKIHSLKTRKGRAQHRSVMIIKIPPPSVTVNRQLELAKKYHKKIANDAIAKLKNKIKQEGGNPTRLEAMTLCMLNKVASDKEIEFFYFTSHQVNEYVKIAKGDYKRQERTLPKDKRTVLAPDTTKIFDPKTGKYKDITFYSNMKFETYGAIRCAADLEDFIRRCSILADGMRKGSNTLDKNHRAAPGDALTGKPEKRLLDWMKNKQESTNNINSCIKAFNI